MIQIYPNSDGKSVFAAVTSPIMSGAGVQTAHAGDGDFRAVLGRRTLLSNDTRKEE
jgi:hypothetical protein